MTRVDRLWTVAPVDDKRNSYRFDSGCPRLAGHTLGSAFLSSGSCDDAELFLLIADVKEVELFMDRFEFRVVVL